jgi:hypothetical protein
MMDELQEARRFADMYDMYLNANMRAKKLESGPGGIMDMKQTIADKEAMIYALESQIGLMRNYADAIDKENEQLQKYRDFVIMIASEQLELSQEKAQLQQRDWRSKAVTLTSQLEFDLNFDTEDTSPLDNDF